MAFQSVGTVSARRQPAEMLARQRRRTPVRVAGARGRVPGKNARGSAIPWVRPVTGAAASPPALDPLPAAIPTPPSRIIVGAVARTASASRRDTSVRDAAGAGGAGGGTVRPVRANGTLGPGASGAPFPPP